MVGSFSAETRRAALPRVALALASVALGLAVPATAGAAAGWQPPVTLSAPGGRAREPKLAFDRRGVALVVWRQAGGVQAALQPPGAGFGSPQTLGAGDSPQVGFDANGDATVLWLRRGNEIGGGCSLCVEVSDRPAGGPFGLPQLVPVEGAYPALAVDPAGDALVLVRDPGGVAKPIRAVFRPAGGAFGAVRTLAGGQTSEPLVALDRRGGAVAVWSRGVHIEGAFARRGGRFGKVRFVGPGDIPQLAVNARGDALAVWRLGIPPKARVLAAFRPSGGRFGKPQRISRSDAGEETHGALDGRGNALAIWRRRDRNGHDNWVEAAFRPVHGRFGKPQRLSRRSAGASGARVAFDSRGNALAIWALRLRHDRGTLLQATYRPAGGRFRKPRTISRSEGIGAIRLSFARSGEALAVWEDFGSAQDPDPASRIRTAAFVPTR